MRNNAIVSLAILKVNFDEQKDYLQTFVPLIAEAIRCSKDEIVSIPSVQRYIKDNFGLNIPQNAIKAILTKVKKEGYIYLEDKTYKRNKSALKRLDFHLVQQSMLRKQEELISSFIKYCEEKFNLKWSHTIAESALQDYIEENQIFRIKNGVMPNDENKDNSTKYFTASFIQYLLDNESYLLEYLEDIIKGMMISTTVFVKDITRIKGKFIDTDVYLDTTFVIYALGYAGKSKQEPCKELLELLYEYGAGIKCFTHTLEEIEGVLKACANKIGKKELDTAYGPSIEYFILEGKTASDIMLFISQLKKNMNAINIKIVDKPDYNNNCYIDEQDLKEKLINGLPYRNNFAVERDIDSISAILRIRKGKNYHVIEDSRAVFLTTNNNLVSFINQYLSKGEEISGAIPIISDYTLTNLLWLKKPIKIPDLPRRKIIADCFAAIQPDDRLWGKYIEEINKLENSGVIGEDESVFFKYAPIMKNIFMEITHGDEEVICEGTVKEIIELSRKRIEDEGKRSLEEEKKKLTKELEATSKAVKSQNTAIDGYARKKAKETGKIVSLILLIFVILVLFIALPIVSSFILRFKLTIITKIIIGIAMVATSVLSFLNSWKGTTIENVSNWVENKKYESIIKEINSNNAQFEVATSQTTEKN